MEGAAGSGWHSHTRYLNWEVRYGVAGKPVVPEDMSRLIDKVETFAVDVFKFKDEVTGENRVFGTGEAHGLFAVTPEAAAAIVLDYPNLKAISPPRPRGKGSGIRRFALVCLRGYWHFLHGHLDRL